MKINALKMREELAEPKRRNDRKIVQNTSAAYRATLTAKKEIEQIAVPANSDFDWGTFQRAAHGAYQKKSTKKMAVAAAKIAELIREHFPNETIRCMVPASEISATAAPGALPVHFLFLREGRPKVAVVTVTSNGHKTPRVIATRQACESAGIKYIKIYADGSFGDWIEGNATPQVADHCKSLIVANITSGLV